MVNDRHHLRRVVAEHFPSEPLSFDDLIITLSTIFNQGVNHVLTVFIARSDQGPSPVRRHGAAARARDFIGM
jgi:hypothetical protein